MYREKTFKLFLKYAIPQMIGLLFNSIYLIVDGIFIGNRLGRDAMAAAGIAVPLIEILIAVSIAISTGAGIIISNRLGSKEYKEAKQTFNLSIVFMAVVGLMIAVLGNLFINQLAALLGSTPDIHDEAVTYLWYIVTFSPFLLYSFLLSGFARNDNRPKLAMIALAVGSVSNIILDYIFMYPLNMGIAGAALATALGPIFSVLILLPHFLLKKGCLNFEKFTMSIRGIREIVKLGISDFMMEFTIGIVTFIYNFTIIKNSYDEIGLAAYLIIGYISLIILTLFLGMAQGLQPIFSYHNGSNETKKNKDMLSFSIKIFMFIGILMYIVVLMFSRGFISIFSPDDTELITFTREKSIVYFCGFLFAGYNILMISFWQSIKRIKNAFFISSLRSVIVLPILITVLPLIFGRETIWICHSLSEMITSCMAFALFFYTARRSKNVL